MNKLTQYQIIHELLTPLNSMISMIELLKLNLDTERRIDQNRIKEFINISLYSSRQMFSSIKQYNTLQEIENQNLKMQINEFDLLESLSEFKQYYQFLANIKGLDLKYQNDLVHKKEFMIKTDK